MIGTMKSNALAMLATGLAVGQSMEAEYQGRKYTLRKLTPAEVAEKVRKRAKRLAHNRARLITQRNSKH